MRVLILSFSEISRDPRVLRQIRALRDHADLSVAGFGSFPDADLSFFSIGKKRRSVTWKILAFVTLLLGLFRWHYWRQLEFPRAAVSQLSKERFDVILANDVNTLPLAFALSQGGCPVLLDAHEYSPGEFSGLAWRLSIGRLYHWICESWLSRVSSMSSVCSEIGDLYGAIYGRSADFIVYNVPCALPGHLDLPTSSDGVIRLVHHGSAEPERRLECMVEMFDLLDERFRLDLVLVGHQSSYAQSLLRFGSSSGRMRLLPPFPPSQIVPSLLSYDVGVFLLPPVNYNYRYALPNKLFEFIQASLAVAVGPTPPMRRIVEEERCGVVSSDFSPAALARELNEMTMAQLRSYQANARACRSRYTSERAERDILARVSALGDG